MPTPKKKTTSAAKSKEAAPKAAKAKDLKAKKNPKGGTWDLGTWSKK